MPDLAILIIALSPFVVLAVLFLREFSRWDAELRRDHQRMQDHKSDLRSGRWGSAAAERDRREREDV